MALKATAWRGVLISQFEEYFDNALLQMALAGGDIMTIPAGKL